MFMVIKYIVFCLATIVVISCESREGNLSNDADNNTIKHIVRSEFSLRLDTLISDYFTSDYMTKKNITFGNRAKLVVTLFNETDSLIKIDIPGRVNKDRINQFKLFSNNCTDCSYSLFEQSVSISQTKVIASGDSLRMTLGIAPIPMNNNFGEVLKKLEFFKSDEINVELSGDKIHIVNSHLKFVTSLNFKNVESYDLDSLKHIVLFSGN